MTDIIIRKYERIDPYTYIRYSITIQINLKLFSERHQGKGKPYARLIKNDFMITNVPYTDGKEGNELDIAM